MKRCVFTIFFLFLSVLMFPQSNHCIINIDSVVVNGTTHINPDTIVICNGSQLLMYSSHKCIDTIFYSDFNGASPMDGWNSNCIPMFTNPCGVGADGSIYAWIGPSTIFPRAMECGPFVLSGQANIRFDMKYASQANSTPCEGPDEATEGVHIQFTNDSVWSDINYWDPLGGYDVYLTNWNNFNIPITNYDTVKIRWFQTNTSGNDYDHWGIDNVLIYYNIDTLQHYINWDDGQNVLTNTDSLIVSPTLSTIYSVSMTTDSLVISDSVFIVMADSVLSINGLNNLYYTNNIPVVISGYPQPGYFTGPGIISPDIFSPSLAGPGVHNITWHYYVLGQSVPIDSIFFSDDFSTDKGWSGYGSGGWTRGSALASVGCSGGNDPSDDHTSTTDNYIIGNYLGSCYPNSLTQTYWLTSPVIDCSNFENCVLEFWCWSGCESNSFDHLYVDVFNGSAWENIYSNTASFSETNWTLKSYYISQASNNADFRVRFGMGTTDNSVTYPGWNIDDIKVKCPNHFQTDTLCSYSYTQQVTVELLSNNYVYDDLLNIKVYPNPAGSLVHIEKDSFSTVCVTISDITGKEILKETVSGPSGNISLDDVSNGLYFLEIDGKCFRLVVTK